MSPRAISFCLGILALATLSGPDLTGAAVSSGGPSFGSRATPTLNLSHPGIVFADSLLTLQSVQAAQAIDPTVRGSYTYNSSTGLYTYSYSVSNSASATNTIWQFAIAPLSNPVSFVAPAHWDGTYGYEERSDAFNWMVTDAGSAPAGWDSVSLWPGPYDVQPGDSASGFSITTGAAPSMVSYFVQGFYVTTPSIDEDGGTDPLTLFQNSLTGSIVGPLSAVGVDPVSVAAPTQLGLAVPNPSRSKVSVTFFLPTHAQVSLDLYRVGGTLVRSLYTGELPPGFQSMVWDGRDRNGSRCSPGVYFYRLIVDGVLSGTRRVVLVE